MHSSEKELLSILNLEVTSVRSKVDRVLHFYQQERSFLRRSFQLAPDLGGGEGRGGEGERGRERGVMVCTPPGPGSSELFACCSEPHVLCEARVAVRGCPGARHSTLLPPPPPPPPQAGSRSVLVKAAVKPSPTPYPLLLLLYT